MTEPRFLLHPAAGHPNEADGLTEREIADVLVRSITGHGLDDLIAAAASLEKEVGVFYVWHDDGCCDNKTESLAEACRWSDEFGAKGVKAYVTDENGGVLFYHEAAENTVRCKFCDNEAVRVMPQSVDQGKTISWAFACPGHAEGWWEGADWDGRHLEYVLGSAR